MPRWFRALSPCRAEWKRVGPRDRQLLTLLCGALVAVFAIWASLEFAARLAEERPRYEPLALQPEDGRELRGRLVLLPVEPQERDYAADLKRRARP